MSPEQFDELYKQHKIALRKSLDLLNTVIDTFQSTDKDSTAVDDLCTASGIISDFLEYEPNA